MKNHDRRLSGTEVLSEVATAVLNAQRQARWRGVGDEPATVAARALPRRVLMTADIGSAIWQYSVQLGAELGRHGIEVAMATLGELPNAQQRAEAERAGIHLYSSGYKLEWMDDPWQDIERGGDWLLQIADRFQPDLVHLNSYLYGSLPWQQPHVVVAHSCVCSWWEGVHGTPVPTSLARYRAAVRAALQKTPWVIAPSRAMLAALVRHYGPLVNGRVIYHGRSPGLYQELAKQPFVLAVGRAGDADKNLDTVAAAARSIAWPVYCAGAASHEQGKRLPGVRALGQLQQTELARWYGTASLFVAPARYEPFGLSTVEAALSGCGLVLSDLPSQRELWEGAAVFVDPHDPEALAAEVNGLIADLPRRRTLMARAKQRAPRYSLPAHTATYLHLYKAMLKDKIEHGVIGYDDKRECYAM